MASRSRSERDAVVETMRARRRSGARAVTTNLVIAETHALLLRRVGRPTAHAFVHEVVRVPNAVVWSTPEIEARARLDWLDRYHDQDFSYTDAVSFAVMAERDIREALTLDHHFAVAGFVTLPS